MINLNETLPPERWNPGFGAQLLITGPCSVETPGQIMQTALGLQSSRVDILRGGVWKPRTQPQLFEGVGTPGLTWLKDAGKAINKPVCVEVANAHHIEEALRHGIDVLWIGARTTANPFSVQEIADALRGVNIPVLVKNPVNPDIELWIGAMKRIWEAGIRKLGAIHRGFSKYQEKKYRNTPIWEVPIELRRRFPNIPILCDPSHISGRRDLLSRVAQQALDLDFNGLMIEAHVCPEQALSDAQQQVTPKQYDELIAQLVFRRSGSAGVDAEIKMKRLREQIDSLDMDFISILAERMQVAQEIGILKQEFNLAVLQEKRWKEVFDQRGEWAREQGLTAQFVQELLVTIHKESIRMQSEILSTPAPVLTQISAPGNGG